MFVATIFPAIPSVIFCGYISVTYGADSWFKLALVSGFSALIYIVMVLFFGLRQQDIIDIGKLVNKDPVRLKPVLLMLARGN